ncbi:MULTISPECIES: FlgO family outer membrane protein [Pseudomonas]|jgi:TolB-like protein|uniref:FlgO family outer membrane protein n=1 Tax=Pseudomonas TaxID=286 RepID=UPI001C80CEAF|nr:MULTISPECIES: FlgO family outer membrane protein [Pseudomonas]MDG9929281.1 FlgO family outer membrane protein [Pseudomonas sp. GD04042]MDH0485489.1 FlgO family outer membrane protein [Pseudomonas sp. GD04015]MDH0607008.1 FlgO family outer membrane protein [Pseudomonas sp. GD03869]
MNLRSSLIVVSLLGGLLLQGCGVSPTRPQAAREESSTPLVRANYRAAESLLEQLRYSLPLKQGAILIGTLVNIDALDRSSTFGRLTTDQISARFTMAGYPMVEMKLRNSAYMLRDQAELMLSREVGDLISSHNAQAVIVGTYAVSRDRVYINLKVIRPQRGIVLAAYDYSLPLDDETRLLLLRGWRNTEWPAAYPAR